MRTTKSKTFYYLRAAGNNLKFQSTLAQAINHAESDRMWRPSPDSPIRRVICHGQSVNTSIAGTLVQIEIGKHQHLFVRPDGESGGRTESAEVPPSREGLPRDVVDGALWFVCKGYHFAIAPSISLNARAFTEHLDWLIRKRFNLVPERDVVDLDPDPGVEAMKALNCSEVKSVSIGPGGNSSFGPRSDSVESDPTSIFSLDNGLISEIGRHHPELKSIFDNEDPDQLGVDLRLMVTVKRKARAEAKTLVRAVAKQLLLNGVEDVEIKFTNKSKVKGNQLIQSAKVGIEHFDGIPSTIGIYSELESWLTKLVDTKQVRP